MKNFIIFSTLVVIVVINFTGCGKAQERPSKPNKAIASQVVAIDGLVDITKAEHQDSEENIAFKKKLISKLDSADKRAYAEGLMAQNKLVYMLMDKKVLLLEFVAAEQNKHITVSEKANGSAEIASATTEIEVTESSSATTEVADGSQNEVKLFTFDALMAMKSGKAQEWSKVTVRSENRFAILAEIAIQTGILENERTDYNEKKSVLALTETSLDQAQVLILKKEIKAEVKAAN